MVYIDDANFREGTLLTKTFFCHTDLIKEVMISEKKVQYPLLRQVGVFWHLLFTEHRYTHEAEGGRQSPRRQGPG